MSPSLEVSLGGLSLSNPVMPASGTFDWFGEESPGLEASALGAVVTKSVTLNPQLGNPPQRVAETPSGMLNTIGIPSVGLQSFIENYLPLYESLDVPVIVSVQAYTPEECEEMVSALSEEQRVDAVEINLSCPNLEHGTIIAQSADLTAETVAAARKAAGHLPMVAKLSPNVASISEIARAAEDGGADALCVMNTLKGMAVNIETRRALLGHVSGGLSGPATKPVALYLVWECFKTVDIPIIGAGGISKVEDAIEFLLAGATAVQVGTATFREPRTLAELVRELRAYMEIHGLHSLRDLTGHCHTDQRLETE